MDTLKKWKFKDHIVIRVKIPITFSLPRGGSQPSKRPNQPLPRHAATAVLPKFRVES